MKVFICLFALIACTQASVLHAPAVLSTGTSSSSRTQDAAGNYAFAYNEQHATGGSSRHESGNYLFRWIDEFMLISIIFFLLILIGAPGNY